MTTIVDITPRSSRCCGVAWLLGAANVLLLTAVVASMLPSALSLGGGRHQRRWRAERNAYLAALCVAPEPGGEGGQALCTCVGAADDPARDCRTFLRVWAVGRDAQRCREGELRQDARGYCTCVDAVARTVSLAVAPDVARRRAHRYDRCRDRSDAPPLPPPRRGSEVDEPTP